jgi:2-keto-4-pentenoate hydratase/2-oxohepta-3-ene-1,7-dioic acid hydratase in catechol pathway
VSRRFARLELSQDSAGSAGGPAIQHGGLAPKPPRRVFVELRDGRAIVLSDPPWSGGEPTGEVLEGVDAEGRGGGARRLAPVLPTKILCVGRNYRAHANELGNEVPAEPLLFMKPPSSLLDPDGAIELPPADVSSRVDHEAELAVVIGRRTRRVGRDEAAAAVFGATAAGDITARDLQKKDGQWTRAKGMDTFCPVGPVITTDLELASLAIECRVSGEVRQRGSTCDMIFGVPDLVAYASRFFTLEPGDLILTGTPSGVGPLAIGDTLEIEIEGIGVLPVRVVAP